MMTREDNDLLTLVEGEAPMGQMLREQHWIPALRAGRLDIEDGPVRVRLLGENFVAFRAEDGRVGFLDEGCPHRGASMALARQEGNGLRCIFHGWKLDVSGAVEEVPTEYIDPEAFAARVPVRRYAVREAGGIVWVWLGKREPAPFPEFGFTRVPADQRFVACTKIPVNWVQGIDATLDSAHIGFLHRDWIAKGGGHLTGSIRNFAPRYEFQSTPYGYRSAALRGMDERTTYVRILEYVMPFYSSTLPNVDNEAAMQILVPIDNFNTLWFMVRWNTRGETLAKETRLAGGNEDLDNWVPIQGNADNRWGQDRKAMRDGSFAGFNRGLLAEDTVVQVSMGPIVDRTREFLSSSDLAIVRTRRLLMQAARDHAAGMRPVGALDAAVPYQDIRASGGMISSQESWQEHFPAVQAA